MHGYIIHKKFLNFSGVFTATIDQHQQKVTVTGNVNVETLLRKLVKAGKHAEIWPEKPDGKGKSSGNTKKNKNEPKETQSLQNKGTENAAKCDSKSKSMSQSSNSKTGGGGSPEKSPAGKHGPPEGSTGGGSSSNKKKKKKDQGGSGCGGGNVSNSINGLSSTSESKSGPAHTGFQFQNHGQGFGQQVNLSPTRQQSFSYSESGYHPMVYVAAYNRSYPMGRVGGPSYYVPSSPYMCAGNGIDQYGTNQFQSAPLVSFEIFSDENANGCSIM